MDKSTDNDIIVQKLNEIQSEIRDLKSSTNKNIDDLKQQFLSFQANMNTHVNALESGFKDVSTEIKNVRSSQEFISNKYDDHRIIVDNCINKSSELKKENELLHKELIKLKKEVLKAECSINELEQYGRRSMVEISGIPLQDDTDPYQVVQSIMKLLDIKLDKSAIDVTHRLSSKSTSPIIIKFKTRAERDYFYANRKKLGKFTLKDINFSRKTRL